MNNANLTTTLILLSALPFRAEHWTELFLKLGCTPNGSKINNNLAGALHETGLELLEGESPILHLGIRQHLNFLVQVLSVTHRGASDSHTWKFQGIGELVITACRLLVFDNGGFFRNPTVHAFNLLNITDCCLLDYPDVSVLLLEAPTGQLELVFSFVTPPESAHLAETESQIAALKNSLVRLFQTFYYPT